MTFVCNLLVASPEVRQTYKQFTGAVVDLIDGEVVSEEFREVALTAYRLFSNQGEEEDSRRIAEKKYGFLISTFLLLFGILLVMCGEYVVLV